MWTIVFEVQSKGNIEEVVFRVFADTTIQAKFKAKQMLALKFPLPGLIRSAKITRVIKEV
jgi:hypothetical protein